MERNQDLTQVSQKLRKNATKEENLLWYNFLRKYRVQFRRQYVIGNYIVDFFCHKAKLVVELDGSQHATKAEAECDQQKNGISGISGTNSPSVFKFRCLTAILPCM